MQSAANFRFLGRPLHILLRRDIKEDINLLSPQGNKASGPPSGPL